MVDDAPKPSDILSRIFDIGTVRDLILGISIVRSASNASSSWKSNYFDYIISA